jgi:hypothetical protein
MYRLCQTTRVPMFFCWMEYRWLLEHQIYCMLNYGGSTDGCLLDYVYVSNRLFVELWMECQIDCLWIMEGVPNRLFVGLWREYQIDCLLNY